MLDNQLLKNEGVCKDARMRAEHYIDNWHTPIGAYTANSKGDPFLRQEISKFIANRDGDPAPDPKNIFLCNGASEAVKVLL